ncbi:hypothetical protein WJX82_006770 [Trebouxia sp. C0006]
MTAGILLDQYCGSFSFDKAKCFLCHDKVQLEPSRVLQDLCAQAVRQYKGKQPGKQLVVQLEAVIQPSVAYFLWVSLSRVQLQASTATDWHDHLQTVVTDQEEQHRSRHQPKQKPTELLVLLLRSALLVLKLASLVQHVSLEAMSQCGAPWQQRWANQVLWLF